jgi:hypothetical protein
METKKIWVLPEVTEIEINAAGTGTADGGDKS